MSRVRLTGLWPLVNGFQAHQTHQAADAMTAGLHAIPRQPGGDLPAAEERVFCEQLVDRVGFACLRLITDRVSSLAGSGR
jgi:hypothetical protein